MSESTCGFKSRQPHHLASLKEMPLYARVVELADSLDSGSSVHYGRAGSSPASRTKTRGLLIGSPLVLGFSRLGRLPPCGRLFVPHQSLCLFANIGQNDVIPACFRLEMSSDCCFSLTGMRAPGFRNGVQRSLSGLTGCRPTPSRSLCRLRQKNEKPDPAADGKQVRVFALWYARADSNRWPSA